jgi:hypothetical protein
MSAPSPECNVWLRWSDDGVLPRENAPVSVAVPCSDTDTTEALLRATAAHTEAQALPGIKDQSARLTAFYRPAAAFPWLPLPAQAAVRPRIAGLDPGPPAVIVCASSAAACEANAAVAPVCVVDVPTSTKFGEPERSDIFYMEGDQLKLRTQATTACGGWYISGSHCTQQAIDDLRLMLEKVKIEPESAE